MSAAPAAEAVSIAPSMPSSTETKAAQPDRDRVRGPRRVEVVERELGAGDDQHSVAVARSLGLPLDLGDVAAELLGGDAAWTLHPTCAATGRPCGRRGR